MPPYVPADVLARADLAVVAELWRALWDTAADERLTLACFSTAIVESEIRNVAFGDKDSLGVFQQRASWGPAAQRMDPYRAAVAFLADATGRVLPKRPDVTAAELAQLVQRSAHPTRYSAAIPAAEHVIATTRPRSGGEPWHPTTSKTSPTTSSTPKTSTPPSPTGTAPRTTEPAMAPRSATEARKVARATVASGRRAWYQLCLKGVREFLGINAVHPSAIAAWRAVKPEDRNTSWPPPPGVPVFWSGGKWGHIALSDGGGWCFSNDIKRRGAYDRVQITLIRERWGLTYLGWTETLNGVRVWPQPVLPPSPPPPPPPRATDKHLAGSRTVQRGSLGTDVAVLQKAIGTVVDGNFGPVTQTALKAWQTAHGLLADGICGPVTWRAVLAPPPPVVPPAVVPPPAADGIFPGALVKLIPGNDEPRIEPVGVILHVAEGELDSLREWFMSPGARGVESHLYVRYDGTTEQYRPCGYEADANLKANSWVADGVRKGYLSVETEGLGSGVWTDAQIAKLKEILLWARDAYGIKLARCTDPYGGGIGYHTMWGAPGPWTNVSGKTCPGPKRIAQFRDVLEPWFTVKGL